MDEASIKNDPYDLTGKTGYTDQSPPEKLDHHILLIVKKMGRATNIGREWSVYPVSPLYDIAEIPENIMPMTIGWLGNSSVATLPTILDLILKNKLQTYTISNGDTIVLASVGAGMNINALIYRHC